MNLRHHQNQEIKEIGIFDAGVGGFSVLNALQTVLPEQQSGSK